MMRFLDLVCKRCGAEVTDMFFRSVPERIIHFRCGGRFEQVYKLRVRDAQWGDKDAVVVFRKPDGTFRYPGRNDAVTPPGCERVTMRSLREVEAFEKVANVRNEAMHYDRGSGTPRPDDMFRGERI